MELAEVCKKNSSWLFLNVLVPFVLTGLPVAILVPVWTSSLSGVIKAAVTSCVAVLLAALVLIYCINAFLKNTRKGLSGITNSSSSSRSDSVIESEISAHGDPGYM